jgi:hypothetical protein
MLRTPIEHAQLLLICVLFIALLVITFLSVNPS